MSEQARPKLPSAGGCQCGAVRYQVNAPPVRVYVCHCLECRKQSASAFGISVWVRRADFALLSGAPRFWSRPTDSGRVLDCAFCPECGSRLWHEYAGGSSEFLTIKGGSLDEPPDLTAVPHVWVKRKMPSVIIPDAVPQFQENPI
jgi:hypothetical protein